MYPIFNFFRRKNSNESINIYYKDFMKVVVFGSIIIVLTIFFTGITNYLISKKAAVEKFKTKDFVYIIESISARIEGKIGKARETALILSKDPTIIKWIKTEENNEESKKIAMKKITDIAKDYEYSNAFIVNASTKNYWAEDGKLLDTLSEKDKDDSWFFETMKRNKPISFSIDYNNERGNTFVFVNSIIYDEGKPIGITGVGLDLNDIANEFESYKFGAQSNLWLIDDKGNICLSEDVEHNGMNIEDFIPKKFIDIILEKLDMDSMKPTISEYVNSDGHIIDLIFKNVKYTDWILVFQIPRSESLSIVNSIKTNTFFTSAIIMILIVFTFYILTKKFFDPFTRTILLNEELETKVNKRTKEIKEKNVEIMDSIHYAKRIQNSILPINHEFIKVFDEHFTIWKPKDIVGGDFYWLKRFGNDFIIAIVDCTGHGVPGALMTMASNAILNYIVETKKWSDPAKIIKELNFMIKESLNKNSSNEGADDGLDIGICYVKNNKEMIFAGAKISLYINNGREVREVKGDKKSVGYKKTDNSFQFKNNFIIIEKGDRFYLTTDGYIHQSGGAKNLPFGRKRFVSIIDKIYDCSLDSQKIAFEKELIDYMGAEEQRDDITVIGFKI